MAVNVHARDSLARPGAAGIDALGALVRHLGASRAEPLPEAVAAHLPDALVRKHMLTPLAYTAGVTRFRKDHIASALLADVRARTLDEVLHAFGSRHIPVMLFKGISYVGALYPEPGARPMSDIDLMVPPDRFAVAARALRGLGYWAAGPPRQRSHLHHAQTFKRRDAAVDLHRSVMQPWRSRIDIQAIWQRARPARDLPGVFRPAPLDEAVLHLAHVARHELRVPAVNYVDAARLLARLERELPGDRGAGAAAQVLERARGYRMERGVAAALAMADALTGCSPAGTWTGPRWSSAWRRVLPSVREVLADAPLGRGLQIVRKLILLDGPRELVGLALVAAHGRLLAHRRA